MSNTTSIKLRGRYELLAWVNDCLETQYQRVEELADGIAYAQIIDACYPGEIPLHRLNYKAKYKDDFERNLKILQKVFKKLRIPRNIPVTKLSLQKFSDNLEFLQWCYSYVLKNFPDALSKYNALERRERAMGLTSQSGTNKGLENMGQKMKQRKHSTLSSPDDEENTMEYDQSIPVMNVALQTFPEQYIPRKHALKNIVKARTVHGDPVQNNENYGVTNNDHTKEDDDIYSKLCIWNDQLMDRLSAKFEANQELQAEIIALQSDKEELFHQLRIIETICSRFPSSSIVVKELHHILSSPDIN